MVRANIDIAVCSSFHSRHGQVDNKFRYKVDYILVPIHESIKAKTLLFSHNKFNLFSFHDKDHGYGGTRFNFAKETIQSEKAEEHCTGEIWLLTQPRFMGYIFNPVSFWYFLGADQNLLMVLAEVNNRAGGRHYYICRHADYTPIKSGDTLTAKKKMYVSPFQKQGGTYTFRFKFDHQHVGAWVDLKNGDEGVYATLTGTRRRMQSIYLLKSAITKPFGALRVVFLIHWQAIKLKFKGARYYPTTQKLPEKNIPKRISPDTKLKEASK